MERQITGLTVTVGSGGSVAGDKRMDLRDLSLPISSQKSPTGRWFVGTKKTEHFIDRREKTVMVSGARIKLETGLGLRTA